MKAFAVACNDKNWPGAGGWGRASFFMYVPCAQNTCRHLASTPARRYFFFPESMPLIKQARRDRWVLLREVSKRRSVPERERERDNRPNFGSLVRSAPLCRLQ